MEHIFLYPDGRDVFVARSDFNSENLTPQPNNLTEFSLVISKPNRIPGFVLIIMGLMIAASGFIHVIPIAFIESLAIPANLDRTFILLAIGIGVTSFGVMYSIMIQKRYGLRIEAVEGNVNVVVNMRKEYANQILHAIQKTKLKATSLSF